MAVHGMQPGETLNSFHDRCLVPGRDEVERKNQVIDGFIRFLHQEFSGNQNSVSQVIKSGSLGKGTAVKGQSDCDLVVFFNNIGSLDKLQSSRERLLDALEQGVRSYPSFQSRIQKKGRTTFSLEYEFQGEKMDILPAFDVVTCLGGKQNVYSRMTAQDGLQYSASLAPLQISFVKQRDDTVKRVIRLLKYWKQTNGLNIRSYTLELVTIFANSSGGGRTVADLFKNAMKLLSNCGSLKIAFNDNYISTNFIRFLNPPYVLDPANPYMNTLRSTQTEEVSRQARRTLHLL